MNMLAKDYNSQFNQAVADFDSVQAKILSKLIILLEEVPTDINRENFSKIFQRAQSTLNIDDLSLSKLFMVSRPTIGRWARGISAPHPIGRKATFEQLAKLAEKKLKDFKDSV